MQALRTAPLPAGGEAPRLPYHAMLDSWLESLDADDDVEDVEMPPHLTSGGIAVAAYYVDAQLRAWPLPLQQLARATPEELDAQLPASPELQPLSSLQVLPACRFEPSCS